MDRERVVALARSRSTAGLVEGARRLGAVLRRPAAERGGLLVVGTPEHEPWHLTAHLDREGNAIHGCRNFGELDQDGLLLAQADRAMQESRRSDAIFTSAAFTWSCAGIPWRILSR